MSLPAVSFHARFCYAKRMLAVLTRLADRVAYLNGNCFLEATEEGLTFSVFAPSNESMATLQLKNKNILDYQCNQNLERKMVDLLEITSYLKMAPDFDYGCIYYSAEAPNKLILITDYSGVCAQVNLSDPEPTYNFDVFNPISDPMVVYTIEANYAVYAFGVLSGEKKLGVLLYPDAVSFLVGSNTTIPLVVLANHRRMVREKLSMVFMVPHSHSIAMLLGTAQFHEFKLRLYPAPCMMEMSFEVKYVGKVSYFFTGSQSDYFPPGHRLNACDPSFAPIPPVTEEEEDAARAGKEEEDAARAGEQGSSDTGAGKQGSSDAAKEEEDAARAGEQGSSDAGAGKQGSFDTGAGKQGSSDATKEEEDPARAGEQGSSDAGAGKQGSSDGGAGKQGSSDAGEEGPPHVAEEDSSADPSVSARLVAVSACESAILACQEALEASERVLQFLRR